MLIGALGYALPCARPQPPVSEPTPVTVEKIVVQLSAEPLPVPAADTPPDPLAAPPPLAPPLAVAAPSPLPFPSPVPCASSRPPPPAPVHPLVFGIGEGRQPAPAYPDAAIRNGQEGTVTVRFSVAADGHVTTADVSAASPWSLLDEAALRVIRHRWRFAPGAVRTYEVAIRFSLKN